MYSIRGLGNLCLVEVNANLLALTPRALTAGFPLMLTSRESLPGITRQKP
jgi:hypothetical protein